MNNKSNHLIWGAYYPRDLYYKTSMVLGYLPPESFKYLDEANFIIDDNNKHVLYHVQRSKYDKKILFDPKNSPKKYSVCTTQVDCEMLANFSYYVKRKK